MLLPLATEPFTAPTDRTCCLRNDENSCAPSTGPSMICLPRWERIWEQNSVKSIRTSATACNS
jgi:hypothetical protein